MSYEVHFERAMDEEAYEIFQKAGFLIVRELFSTDLIAEILSEIINLNKSEWQKNYGGRTAFIKNSAGDIDALFGVSYAQPITSYIPCATKLYGKELLDISSFLMNIDDPFYKEAELHVRHSKYRHKIPAHQDNFYFSLSSPRALTCYVYLTEQSKHSGGLGFLPQMMQETFPHKAGGIEGFSSFDPIKELVPEKFYYPITRAGDVVFHHCNTFHRADENLGQQFTASISARVLSRTHLAEDKNLKRLYKENLEYNRNV